VQASASEFDELVAQALDGLPAWVQERMDNVAVLVAPWPTADQRRRMATRSPHRLVLGLYEGVPLTRRGRGYNLQAPDRITLFSAALLRVARDRDHLVELIQRTVMHEIGHHFGFGEADLSRIGL